MFSSLMFFSYYRAQNWKKKNKKKQVIETIKYDQHWIFNLASSDVSVKAFLYFNLFKAGVGDVWPCIVTRRGLFFFFVVLFFVPALICLSALYQFLSPLKSHKSLFKIEETKQTWWSQWAWWLLSHSVHQGLEEEEEEGGRGRAGVWEFSHLEKACGAVLTSDGCVCVLCNFSIFQWSDAEKVSVVTNSLE